MGLVWIDAHGDFHTPQSSETGNPHGMPLAAIVGDGDPRLTSIADGAVLDPENLVVIGCNALDRAEIDRFEERSIEVVTMIDINERGLAAAFEAINSLRSRVDLIFVSIDADVMDYRVSSGTPMVNDAGLNEDKIVSLTKYLGTGANAKLLGFEIVEYSEKHDSKGHDTARILTRVAACLLGSDYGAYALHMERESKATPHLAVSMARRGYRAALAALA